jgi:hypothetical protein
MTISQYVMRTSAGRYDILGQEDRHRTAIGMVLERG